MPRQPYEEVIANVKKWAAPEVMLRKDFVYKRRWLHSCLPSNLGVNHD